MIGKSPIHVLRLCSCTVYASSTSHSGVIQLQILATSGIVLDIYARWLCALRI